MKRTILLSVFLGLLAATRIFATTVTATLKDVSGGALVTRGDYVTFQLLGFGRNVPRVTAPHVVVNAEPLKVYSGTNGQISTFIQGNDTISPATTFWRVRGAPGDNRAGGGRSDQSRE